MTDQHDDLERLARAATRRGTWQAQIARAGFGPHSVMTFSVPAEVICTGASAEDAAFIAAANPERVLQLITELRQLRCSPYMCLDTQQCARGDKWQLRAEAAEAELERVRAERDRYRETLRMMANPPDGIRPMQWYTDCARAVLEGKP